MQAVLAAAPDDLFSRLWDALFVGSLVALTSNPIANFVVQAALASARTGDQVREIRLHRAGQQDDLHLGTSWLVPNFFCREAILMTFVCSDMSH